MLRLVFARAVGERVGAGKEGHAKQSFPGRDHGAPVFAAGNPHCRFEKLKSSTASSDQSEAALVWRLRRIPQNLLIIVLITLEECRVCALIGAIWKALRRTKAAEK